MRGFRLQALYVLHLLLDRPGDLMRPEGIEDVDVLHEGKLVEVCQIKALSGGLALSDLDPDKPDGFFRRCIRLTREQPAVGIRIVSYGPIGPELAAAIGRGAAGRRPVYEKLGRAGIGRADADQVLDRLTIQSVSEQQITDRVIARLREIATGHDPEAAFELLLLSVHVASEQRHLLDHAGVASRLLAVGQYLSERSTHSAEWFTTIEPLMEPDLTEAERDRLRDEFAVGVAAEFEHIRAGAAVERREHLEALRLALGNSRVVIIHGASGEGKTALALSFLAELPAPWRFRVREMEGARHARSIARALLGHAHALQVPLYVHLDVGPGSTSWPILVRELSRSPDVRVIVTIREEDWRRASTNAEFAFVDLELSMTEAEARDVYAHLRAESDSVPPTFEDAWQRFGGHPGPLLEFVHLCTQGEGLRERLAGQVARLRDDVRTGRLAPEDLNFLRLVSVAGAYEAAVDLAAVAQLVALREPMSTVGMYEREYLLRTSTGGRLVVGLHPLRSTILADLLCDQALAPWATAATLVFPTIIDGHVERFLTYALSRRPLDERQALLGVVTRDSCESWVRARGIVSALLWRGLADYAERNRPLIEEVHGASPGFWSLLLNWDVARVNPEFAEGMFDQLADIHPGFANAAARAREVRARQTDPAEVFEWVVRWLDSRTEWPRHPIAPEEWAGLGQVLFWAGRVGAVVPIDGLQQPGWESAVAGGTMEDLSDAAAGLASVAKPAWWDASLPKLLDRFRLDTATPWLEDDGNAVSIEYLYDPERASLPGGFDLNEESVWRLGLLRNLLPNREVYKSLGHGHRLIEADHDPSVKAIPAGSLAPNALPTLNSSFHGYSQRWFRLDTWTEFWQQVLLQRQAAVAAMQAATSLLTEHFRQRPRNRGDEVGRVVGMLRAVGDPVPLPKAAVDEWGFVSETRKAPGRADGDIAGGVAITPYLPFWRAYRDWTSSLATFARNSPDALVLYLALGQPGADEPAIRAAASAQGINEAGAGSTMESLSRTRQALRALDSASATLAPAGLQASLSALSARETTAYDGALLSWRALLEAPKRRLLDVLSTERQDRVRRLDRIRGEIRLAVSGACQASVMVHPSVVGHPDGPALLVTCDWTAALVAIQEINQACVAIASVSRGLGAGDRDRLVESSPTILVVSLVRGRPLAAEGIALNTAVLAHGEGDPPWYTLMPRPIDGALLMSRRLPPWTDPLLTVADSLVANSAGVWTSLRHLGDLRIEHDLDDVGEQIARRHVERITTLLEHAAKEVLAETSHVAELLSAREADSEVVEELRGAVGGLAKSLGGFRVGDAPSLAEQAETVVGLALVSRAAWIDSVLDGLSR